MQNILLFSDFHRMAGIVASLGAQYPIGLRSHDIQNFSLPLISPLKTKDDCDARVQINPEASCPGIPRQLPAEILRHSPQSWSDSG